MMNYEEALRLTTEAAWGRLLVNSKQEALQSIERHIAAFEGRPERSVVIENMNDGYYGYYNHSDSAHIHISPQALRTPEEAIKTVLHEGRHAYQHDCLDRNDGFPQPILEQFRNGFEHYISPEENFKAYANNFTELDAEDFAEQQSQLLDMERAALLYKEHDSPEEHELKSTYRTVSEDSSIGRDSLLTPEMLASYETNLTGGYDWENQATFPVMGRELEKVKGGSETDTLVTDLRDIPMSPQDFQQYYDYFSSEEVNKRPNDQRHSMASCLQAMGLSLTNKDEIGYYESRNLFLENDANYRLNDRESKMNMAPSVSSESGVSERAEPEMNMAPSASIERRVAERAESEMNMAPSASIERGVAERAEPEMNMAPSASIERGVAEYVEPEINMAPSASVEHGMVEHAEPKMDMAPRGFGERETLDHTEPNMDRQENTQIKPDNIRDTNDEAQSVGESATQNLGMSW